MAASSAEQKGNAFIFIVSDTPSTLQKETETVDL